MPRKTLSREAAAALVRCASMRPRPDAAENDRPGRRVHRDGPASMRPRPDAAENVLPLAGSTRGRPRLQ